MLGPQPVYTFSVPHNTASGVNVGTLTVSDADDSSTVNGQLTTIIDDAGATGIFTLSTLTIQTATTMDYSIKNQYEFQVKVSDGATPQRLIVVYIFILETTFKILEYIRKTQIIDWTNLKVKKNPFYSVCTECLFFWWSVFDFFANCRRRMVVFFLYARCSHLLIIFLEIENLKKDQFYEKFTPV